MRLTALGAFALIGVMAGDCSNDGSSPHDSAYAYGYVYPPAAPTLDSLVAGDGTITAHFTSAGGEYFRPVCNVAATGAYGRTGFTYKSPGVLDSLQNGVEYSCNVTAFNGSRPSKSSASLKATPKAP